jgi:hypothetical protein
VVVVVLRWTTLILCVAFFAASIYAFSNHAFWRHYALAYILTSVLLSTLTVIVALTAGRSAGLAVRRS